jgi:hypothetical protein
VEPAALRRADSQAPSECFVKRQRRCPADVPAPRALATVDAIARRLLHEPRFAAPEAFDLEVRHLTINIVSTGGRLERSI